MEENDTRDVATVTGASTGIGEAWASAMAAKGRQVVLVPRPSAQGGAAVNHASRRDQPAALDPDDKHGYYLASASPLEPEVHP